MLYSGVIITTDSRENQWVFLSRISGFCDGSTKSLYHPAVPLPAEFSPLQQRWKVRAQPRSTRSVSYKTRKLIQDAWTVITKAQILQDRKRGEQMHTEVILTILVAFSTALEKRLVGALGAYSGL